MTKVKTKRVIPGIKELAGLLKFRKPIFSAKRRRLSRALTIYDLRKLQSAELHKHRLITPMVVLTLNQV